MHEADNVILMDQVSHQGVRKPDSRSSPIWEESPNAPGVLWFPAEPTIYDELDLRLMDTFPASDVVARY
jgi:hypothetical protein